MGTAEEIGRTAREVVAGGWGPTSRLALLLVVAAVAAGIVLAIVVLARAVIEAPPSHGGPIPTATATAAPRTP